MIRVIFLLLLFLISPLNFVFAEITNGNVSVIEAGDNSYILIIKLILYMGTILFLIFIFFRFLSKKSGFVKSNFYQHLGGISLGQKKMIQVVEIGNKVYILGIGEDVNLINVLDVEEDIDAIKDSINLYNDRSNNLKKWFNKKFLRKKHNSKVSQFEHELNEKMEQLKDRRTQSVYQLLNESNERYGKRDQNE